MDFISVISVAGADNALGGEGTVGCPVGAGAEGRDGLLQSVLPLGLRDAEDQFVVDVQGHPVSLIFELEHGLGEYVAGHSLHYVFAVVDEPRRAAGVPHSVAVAGPAVREVKHRLLFACCL